MPNRKLIVTNMLSVDGAFTGAGGNVMAMPFTPDFSAYNAERLRTAGTLLLGRESFEGFLDYWPSVADDPNQPDLEREISRRNNTIEKVVVSDTLTELGAWAATTEVVGRSAARERVAALKAEAGADILVFGSHILWNALLNAGLVDELHLLIGPGIVGDGIPAFERVDPVGLALLDIARPGDSDLVLLRYRVGTASVGT